MRFTRKSRTQDCIAWQLSLLVNLPLKMQGSEYLLERLFLSFVLIRQNTDGFDPGWVRGRSIVPLFRNLPNCCFAEKAKVELRLATHKECFELQKQCIKRRNKDFFIAVDSCDISIFD